MNKKQNQLWLAFFLVFVVVFNTIVFLVRTEYTSAFWVSYAAIHVAYFLFFLSSSSLPKVKNALVFGYPLVALSAAYFVCSFLVGMAFMYWDEATFNASFIPQLILAAIYALLVIPQLFFTEASIARQQENRTSVDYIRMHAQEILALMNQVKERAFQKKLEKVYDAFQSSQLKTHPSLFGVEDAIAQSVQRLKETIREEGYQEAERQIEDLLALIAERNAKLSMVLLRAE
ncbi:hypothetical protein [Gorillibacterium sp. CAU 1737]|uniref:hypothetical protein n=1 Tax=Gorillibacterium sp. CAU 1737 TaxID=3140362 RepID=UPI003261784F